MKSNSANYSNNGAEEVTEKDTCTPYNVFNKGWKNYDYYTEDSYNGNNIRDEWPCEYSGDAYLNTPSVDITQSHWNVVSNSGAQMRGSIQFDDRINEARSSTASIHAYDTPAYYPSGISDSPQRLVHISLPTDRFYRYQEERNINESRLSSRISSFGLPNDTPTQLSSRPNSFPLSAVVDNHGGVASIQDQCQSTEVPAFYHRGTGIRGGIRVGYGTNQDVSLLVMNGNRGNRSPIGSSMIATRYSDTQNSFSSYDESNRSSSNTTPLSSHQCWSSPAVLEDDGMSSMRYQSDHRMIKPSVNNSNDFYTSSHRKSAVQREYDRINRSHSPSAGFDCESNRLIPHCSQMGMLSSQNTPVRYQEVYNDNSRSRVNNECDVSPNHMLSILLKISISFDFNCLQTCMVCSNFELNPNAEPTAKLCYDFLNSGFCKRERESGICRFRHIPVDHIDAIVDRIHSGKMRVCLINYHKGLYYVAEMPCYDKKYPGELNSNASIGSPLCPEYTLYGRCSTTERGLSCPFRHLVICHPERVAYLYMNGKLSDTEIQAWSLTQCSDNEVNPFSNPQEKLCFDFMNLSVCKRNQEGKICRFRHLLYDHSIAIENRNSISKKGNRYLK